MKVKNCLLLALAAGAATPAMANVVVNPNDSGDRIVSSREEATIPLYLDENGIVQQGTPFMGRDIRPIVYSAFPADTRPSSITTILSAFRGFAHVGDDIQFDPGIGAAGVGQLITYTVPVGRDATPTTPTNADLVIRFWDTGTLTANPMVTGTAFDVDTFEDVGLQLPANTNGLFLLTITPTTPVTLPNADTSIFVEYEWRAAVAGTGNGGTGALVGPAPTINTTTGAVTRNQPFRFYGWGNVLDTTGSSSGAGPRHANIMGSTIRGFGRDADQDGILEGQPVIAKGATPFGTFSEFVGPHAGLPTAVDLFGGTNAEARVDFEMRGVTASPLPPTADQDLGQLADGITNSNVLAVAPGGGQNGTVWIRFTLGADVTDVRDAFLDITTQNAATTIPDPIMVLYSNDGQFVVFPGSDAGIDDDDAAGLLSQLSFGMGNRPATSTGPTGGETFNGEDGELLAADGPFWLGIAATPVSNAIGIDEGFQLFTNATQGGNVQVTFNTNYIAAPSNLPPSVVPTLTREYLPAGGNPGDPIAAPGAAGAENDPGDPDVLWYKFTTCKPVENNDGDAGDFVDMDFFISNALAVLDDIAFIFDQNGNLFATSDDGDADGLPIPDAYTKPQFSFGNRGPRPSPGAAVGAAAFAGQNGGLPPGTWYVAHCYFGQIPGPQTRADAQGNGRWFVRPVTPNDSLGLQMDIFTGLAAGDCSVCDGIDFNGDGVFPDNQDIISLFTVFGGGACGDDVGVPSDTCHDIDFNNDGVFPDNLDLVEYLNAFAGGTCPS